VADRRRADDEHLSIGNLRFVGVLNDIQLGDNNHERLKFLDLNNIVRYGTVHLNIYVSFHHLATYNTEKPEQQRFTMGSGVLTVITSRQRSAQCSSRVTV